jgi:hypothetical protein
VSQNPKLTGRGSFAHVTTADIPSVAREAPERLRITYCKRLYVWAVCRECALGFWGMHPHVTPGGRGNYCSDRCRGEAYRRKGAERARRFKQRKRAA